MEGLTPNACARCGRGPVAGALVHGHCTRCRALELVNGFDGDLSGHARRVTHLAVLVADELRVEQRCRHEVELGGLLHDIGKLTIPAEILAKAGPLDENEQRVMRTHVTEGERLAGGLEALPESVPVIVRHSHERWRSEEHTSELQSRQYLVCRLLLEKKKKTK